MTQLRIVLPSDPEFTRLQTEGQVTYGQQINDEWADWEGDEDEKSFDPNQERDEHGRWVGSDFSVTIDGKKIRVVDPKMPDHHMMWVDAAAVDKLHQQQDMQGHIGPNGEGGLKGRYEGVKKWLQENDHLEAPYMYINDREQLTYGNGRHRFAVMRDAGLKRIPVSLGEEKPGLAEKLGLKPDHNKAFDPDQLRDYNGRWATTGSFDRTKPANPKKRVKERKFVRDIAAQLGYDPELVDVAEAKDVGNVVLDNSIFKPAGVYDPQTGMVRITRFTDHWNEDEVAFLVAHEIGHAKFTAVDRDLTMKKFLSDKDPEVAEAIKQFPVSELRSTGDVTRYSAEYWKAAPKAKSGWFFDANHNLAVSETYAEVSAIQATERRGRRVGPPEPVPEIWKRFAEFIDEKHRKLSKDKS